MSAVGHPRAVDVQYLIRFGNQLVDASAVTPRPSPSWISKTARKYERCLRENPALTLTFGQFLLNSHEMRFVDRDTCRDVLRLDPTGEMAVANVIRDQRQ